MLTVAVVDELCDWNRGIYRIETEGSEPEITRTSDEADLTLSVERLAQLLSGYASPGELARMELLDAPDRRVLATADALFLGPFTGRSARKSSRRVMKTAVDALLAIPVALAFFGDAVGLHARVAPAEPRRSPSAGNR